MQLRYLTLILELGLNPKVLNHYDADAELRLVPSNLYSSFLSFDNKNDQVTGWGTDRMLMVIGRKR